MDTDATSIPTELQRTLPGSAGLDPGAFEAERERVFHREWFCVGREETLPAPGDFIECPGGAGQPMQLTAWVRCGRRSRQRRE